MSKRHSIPPDLAVMPFSIRDAMERGISIDRLRSLALDRPFHGVRAVGVDLSLLENRCLSYATRMRGDAMFSHATAAELWELPLPLRLLTGPVHVTVSAPVRAPRVAGVVGHTRSAPVHAALLRGLVVTSAAETWADLAEILEVPDLVAVGEMAVTGNPFRQRPPITSIEELRAVTERRRRMPGSRARVLALASIRMGALSRPETLTRLLLVGAGVPYPLINPSIYDDRGVLVAVPDLSWPEFKVALEYEGDDHRTKKRFRADIGRVERLVDHGWLVVKVSADDLFDNPRDLVERVVRRLSSRGWVPGGIRLPKNGVFER